MPIYKGTSEISPTNIVLGGKQIAKVYVGDTLVWQKNYSETAKYGFLYNLYAVQDPRSIAPTGWHVPTLAEYLTIFGIEVEQETDGGKLKGLSTYPDEHPRWNDPNIDATNEFGWNGYGGGYREDDGTFDFNGFKGFWWTADGYYFGLNNDSGQYFYSNDFDPRYGLSIRLLKDDDTLEDFTDNNGNVYSTVNIGSQVWMAENLRTTRFKGAEEANDYIDFVLGQGGVIEDEPLLHNYYLELLGLDESHLDIPNVIPDLDWKSLSTDAYCIYDYNRERKDLFHNKLKGLQGGKEPDEYYHLTEGQYNELHDRLHSIDSVEDHDVVEEVDRGKFVFADPITGEISLKIPPSTNYQVTLDVEDEYINTGDTYVDIDEMREYRLVEDEFGTKYMFEITSPKVIQDDSVGVSPKSIKLSMI